MDGFRLIVVLLISSTSPLLASADDGGQQEALLERSSRLALHESASWRALLFYSDVGVMSEVRSPEFFLAPDGRRSARAELQATIRGWFDPARGDAHPRCRFPARYQWLESQLDLPEQDAPVCAAFDRWARLDELHSVGLVFAEPSHESALSAFGHMFLSLDRNDTESGMGPLDTAVSFNVMPFEGSGSFPMNLGFLFGVFGGQYSMMHTVELQERYRGEEGRDMWHYQLSLDQAQRRMLVGHLWEVAGLRFPYYLQSENCALRLAQILTTVTGVDLEGGSYWFFSPMEFMELVEAHRAAGSGLFGRVDYHPSNRTRLKAALESLSSDEREELQRIMQGAGSDLAAALSRFEAPRRSMMLDALHLYDINRRGREDPDESSGESRALSSRVLALRLADPGKKPPLDRDAADRPVLHRHPVQSFGFGAQSDGGGGVYMHATAYRLELGDDPDLRSGLVLFDLTLATPRAGGGVQFDSLDLLRHRDLGKEHPLRPDRPTWARQSRFAYSRAPGAGADHLLEFTFGFGRAMWWGRDAVVYAMLDLGLSDGVRPITLEPNFGLLTRHGAFAFGLDARWRRDMEADAHDEVLTLDARYAIARNMGWSLGVVRDDVGTRVRAGIEMFW